MLNKLKNNSIFILLLSSLFIIVLWQRYNDDEPRRIFENGDVWEYYQYLPAFFVYNDIAMNFYDPANKEHHKIYGPVKAANEKWVIKFTMGVALLNSPFFIVAHLIASTTNFEASGYSSPYVLALVFANLFYLFLGLFYLRKILLKYFPLIICDISLVLIVLATNIFYFTMYIPGMSHIYTFALVSIFIFNVIKWHNNNKFIHLLILSFALGIIVLIRPVNIIFGLFFFLYNTNNINDLWQKLRISLLNIRIWIIPAIIVLVFTPQIIYWKYQTGQWFYYTYGDEGFFFNDPQFINGFFSFRAGLFIYSPILLLSVIGFWYLKNKLKQFSLSIVSLFIIFSYVAFSWWCWWYVGFGNRAFIDIYPFLIIPMTAVIYNLWYNRLYVRYISFLIISFFVFLSLFQSYQAKKGIIHFWGMTYEAYKTSFFNLQPKHGYYDYMNFIDHNKAIKGYRGVDDYYNYKDVVEFSLYNAVDYNQGWTSCINNIHHGKSSSGEYSQRLDGEYSLTFSDTLKNIYNVKPDSIRLSVMFYPVVDSTEALLVFNLIDADTNFVWKSFPLKTYQISKNEWNKAFVYIPWYKEFEPHMYLKYYVWNPAFEELYLDDFEIKLFH